MNEMKKTALEASRQSFLLLSSLAQLVSHPNYGKEALQLMKLHVDLDTKLRELRFKLGE